VSDLKVWNYDGSSTGQADGHNSEVLLKPRAIFNDCFRDLVTHFVKYLRICIYMYCKKSYPYIMPCFVAMVQVFVLNLLALVCFLVHHEVATPM